MSVTLELPDLWLIVAPDGTLDGFIKSVLSNGKVLVTAEQAHAFVTPRKRDRDKELRDGWTVRGGSYAEWNERVR